MNKYNISIILFILCCGFVLIDYSLNDYSEALSANIGKPAESSPYPVEINTPFPGISFEEILVNSKLEGYTISSPSVASKLFQSILLEKIGLVSQKYKLIKENKIAVNAYKINGDNMRSRDIYLKMKTTLEKAVKKHDDLSVNETNDFGNASFYFNDSKRSHLTFLIAEFDKGVFAFEYPKPNHSIVQDLVVGIR